MNRGSYAASRLDHAALEPGGARLFRAICRVPGFCRIIGDTMPEPRDPVDS